MSEDNVFLMLEDGCLIDSDEIIPCLSAGTIIKIVQDINDVLAEGHGEQVRLDDNKRPRIAQHIVKPSTSTDGRRDVQVNSMTVVCKLLKVQRDLFAEL